MRLLRLEQACPIWTIQTRCILYAFVAFRKGSGHRRIVSTLDPENGGKEKLGRYNIYMHAREFYHQSTHFCLGSEVQSNTNKLSL